MAAGLHWRVVRDTSSSWSRRLHARVLTETNTFCENILLYAQATVRVRTGATRDSGRVEQVSSDPIIYRVMFDGAALYLEFGTVHHPAYPFLRPAYAQAIGQYLGRLAMTTQGRIRQQGFTPTLESNP